jgi:hypothetical protein
LSLFACESGYFTAEIADIAEFCVLKWFHAIIAGDTSLLCQNWTIFFTVPFFADFCIDKDKIFTTIICVPGVRTGLERLELLGSVKF